MALGEDAVQVFEIDGNHRDLWLRSAEVKEPAADRRDLVAGAPRSLRKQDGRVPIPEHLEHLIDRLPAEPAGWGAGGRGPVAEDGVEAPGGQIAADHLTRR